MCLFNAHLNWMQNDFYKQKRTKKMQKIKHRKINIENFNFTQIKHDKFSSTSKEFCFENVFVIWKKSDNTLMQNIAFLNETFLSKANIYKENLVQIKKTKTFFCARKISSKKNLKKKFNTFAKKWAQTFSTEILRCL